MEKNLFRVASKNDWYVSLEASDAGIAPGQFIVFYDDDECLGGGAISDTL